MIDVENLLFDTFYNRFQPLHEDVNITAGYDELNATFPCVIFRQTNNQPYRNSITDDCAENHTRITVEVEVVSDKMATGRSECKELLNDADDIMQSLKFRRVHMNRPLNIDRTKWRQYARYEVIVGKPIEVDGNTVYQMYRR